ncbi:Clp protease N-terminal domain-containing protein [Streptomyces abikoensis]|uniref:Clp protease N-terminal domain-containing protein n=1 Tax=Streptomyces abikoensis TaxID=97398 RepID=A0ABW7SVG6_9ACTN
MFERFTKDARTAVVDAQEEARALGHARIGTEHLLVAIAGRTGAPAAATLARFGVTAESCRAAFDPAPAASDGHFDEDDAEALRAFGIDLDAVRDQAERAFGPGALDAPPPALEPAGRRLLGLGRNPAGLVGHIPFAPRAKKALERSLREARTLKSNHIGLEHVLLGVLGCDDETTADYFRRLGVEPAALRAGVLADLGRAA